MIHGDTTAVAVAAHGRGCYPVVQEPANSREKRMRRSTFALGCAAALAFVVAGAAHGAEPVKIRARCGRGGGARGAGEPVKIRASWVVAPSDWTPLLLEKPDLMKHQGKSYAFDPIRFQGTPAVITA